MNMVVVFKHFGDTSYKQHVFGCDQNLFAYNTVQYGCHFKSEQNQHFLGPKAQEGMLCGQTRQLIGPKRCEVLNSRSFLQQDCQ
jgi:hypothetical protein